MPFALAALPWLKKFGPWILIGLVAIGVYAAANTMVRDWKKTLYENGVKDGVSKESARQDAIARKIEQILTPRLDAIDQNTGRQITQQAAKEIQYVERIRTQIKTDPRYRDCAVDASLLADRNALRASLATSLPTEAGSSPVGEANTVTPNN